MEELIKLKDYNGQKVVNARDLHELLESKKDFSEWIKNKVINSSLFVENEDYCLLPNLGEQKNGRGGHNKIEYALTINVAKQVALMENTQKGKEIRQYFIECEKELNKLKPQFQLPQTYAEALRELAVEVEKRVLAEKKAEVNEQKAILMDHLIHDNNNFSFNNAAKILEFRKGGKKYGRNLLIQFLRERNILMKSNVPYETYVKQGYFGVRTEYISTGATITITHVTGKGLAWMEHNRTHWGFDAEKGVLA